MAIWNDPSPYTEYNDLIEHAKSFKLHGLMDKVIAKRTELLTDKKAKWLEEQRHKWMCGEQPDYLEDCPFNLGRTSDVRPKSPIVVRIGHG